MGNLRRIRRHGGKLRQSQISSVGSDGRPELIELDRSELESILERAKTTALSEREYDKLHAAMETLIFLTSELEKKRVSIQRLKHLLFGVTTETTQKVMEKILDEAGKCKPGDDTENGKEAENHQKAKGHGRNGAEKYTGARLYVCSTNPSSPEMPAQTVTKELFTRAWNRAGLYVLQVKLP